jgi:hypothetical protein
MGNEAIQDALKGTHLASRARVTAAVCALADCVLI